MDKYDIFIKQDELVTETLVDPDEFFISYMAINFSSSDNILSESSENISDTITITCDENIQENIQKNIQENVLVFIDSDNDKLEIIDSDISDV